MHAIEFESRSKGGVIYIPEEYKGEIDNKEKIRLVVMYDTPSQNSIDDTSSDLKYLERLFLNSDNQIKATRQLIDATDEMCNDIS